MNPSLTNKHPFHLVDQSPWPIILSFSIFSLMINLFSWISSKGQSFMPLEMSLISSFLIIFQWARDIMRESTFQGHHAKKVRSGIVVGMVMFISSELMFFFSFFLSLFYLALNPDVELGSKWPPVGIEPLEILSMPFLNTFILFLSSITVTLAHNFMLTSNFNQTSNSLGLTISLGVLFIHLQKEEYVHSSFSMADGSFGSIFFISTGFHGLHVIIGVILLTIMFSRLHFLTSAQHTGFEMAAWYWHFVDTVWMFLFITFYWWSS